MGTRQTRKVVVWLVVATLLGACGGNPPPAGTAVPASVPPTSIPPTEVPTGTEVPTPFPVPTPTSSPTPRPQIEPVAELVGSAGPVYSLAWSPDGRLLASAGYAQVKLWESGTGEDLATLGGHTDYVWGVAWSPDGRLLASAGQDGTVRLWDRESLTQTAVLELKQAWCVTWSPDGGRVAAGSLASSEGVRVWDAHTGETLSELADSTDPSGLISLGWSPDGRTIAGGHFFGSVVLWDAETGKARNRLVGTTKRGDVNGLAWSPNGDLLAAAQQDGRVRLWDGRSGELVRELECPAGWARGVAWSPDGRLLASAGQDGTVILWDVQSGQELIRQKSGDRPLWSAAWSPDGSRIAVGSGTYEVEQPGGTVYVWDVSSLVEPRGEDKGEARDEAFCPSRDRGLPAAGGLPRQRARGRPFPGGC